MKITEPINLLERIRAENGDLTVQTRSAAGGWDTPEDNEVGVVWSNGKDGANEPVVFIDA